MSRIFPTRSKGRPHPARRIVRWTIALLGLAALGLATRGWLAENPQHNPWAPLDLNDPRGLATGWKLAALQGDVPQCREVLERSDVLFTVLEVAGEGACLREDRIMLESAPLSPSDAAMTCPVAVGLTMWIEKDVRPMVRDILGSELSHVEQLGTYNCRRIGGAQSGRWSEHATGNAIDISAFVLEDGRRVSVLQDWSGESAEAQFLLAVRDAACTSFGTVLSPDYNAAHADHLHLDWGSPAGRGLCR